MTHVRKRELQVSVAQSPLEPLVSIVVPVYRVPEPLLRQCIESLLAQSMHEIEIILVDDGSPDDCGRICDGYARSDGRVHVIHQENRGLAAARNTGQAAARGRWLMFVDGDDWVEPTICDSLYATALKHGVQLVISGMTRDYAKTSIPYTYSLSEDTKYVGGDCRALQVKLLKFDENIATVLARLIDRSLLIRHGLLHDETLRQGAEGIEFNVRLFEQLESVAFTKGPFYHYVYNRESISSSHDESNHAAVLACFEKIHTLIAKSGNEEALRPWLYNRLLYVVVTTAISGYFHPRNPAPYAVRRRDFLHYLEAPLIREAMRSGDRSSLSRQRQLVLGLIDHRLTRALDLAGRARYWQKGNR